ncbi:MAG: DUF1553 domain-containing protein [Planctomycetaceae bacterium]|nr:DUF1553 domain-containing protein [Planctomycetaceae bacterium]
MKTFAFTLSLLIVSYNFASAEAPQFNRDIRAILSDRCYTCHGPDSASREADLRLDVRESATSNSDAPAIVPGKPAASELLKRVRSRDEFTQMPPPDSGKEPLSDQQIKLLEQWIEEGAEYEDHWAFIPPQKSDIPAVQHSERVRNPIDAFVLRKLETKGLEPSPTADKRTLIRRVSLDLTGLPPTPEEIDAFLNDESPHAYEKLVDRLLASHRYGEHMARYWLDAARYADTNGYQYDLEREQWVWRDWVIWAFNQNMPFDEFTRQQIAGDLLPNANDLTRLATGFQRNHPITIEGGVIDEEYRTEYVVDRVVTTSTVWMGLTMICGRCHDHKYDPISQTEFYEFFAFFNRVPERGLRGFDPKKKIESPLRDNRLDDIEHRLAQAREHLQTVSGESGLPFAQWESRVKTDEKTHWQVVLPTEMKSTGGATLTIQDDRSVLAGGKNPVKEEYVVDLDIDAEAVSAIRLEALKDPSTVNGGTGRGSNGNFVLTEFVVEVESVNKPGEFERVEIEAAEADYSQKNYEIGKAIDGQIDRSGWAVDGNTITDSRTAVFVLAEPIRNANNKTIRVRMSFQFGLSHQIARFRLSVNTGEAAPLTLAIQKILETPANKRNAAQKDQLQEWLLKKYASPEVRQAANQLAAVEREKEQLLKNIPATMIMAEQENPRTTHVLYRGEYDKPREEVDSGVPDALPALPEGVPNNRLALAEWLVQPDHPLTSRVFVNRTWQRLFGVGIVKTSEDFGSQGEWPSHPELLDWLAVEFVDSGWDIKGLHKLIVMSNTYRQSSRVTPEQKVNDPENRLLARGPRRRLDAEVVRDSALLASGLLVEKLGGPSVFPYHPEGLWQEINNRPGYSRTYQQDSGDKLYRRSLYTFWKRTVPPPSMATFDAPEREFCVVRRSRTNTPLQAFVLLHDPQFVEAARKLATRMLTEVDGSLDEQISHGVELVTSRLPSEREKQVLKETYQQRLKKYQQQPELATELLSVGDSPRDESLDLAQHAAMTSLARLMLNLSEFVTLN